MLKNVVTFLRYLNILAGASGTAMILSKFLGIISFSWWIVLSPYFILILFVGCWCTYIGRLTTKEREELFKKLKTNYKIEEE